MSDQPRSLQEDLELIHELAQRNRHAQLKGVLKRLLPAHPDNEELQYYAAYIDLQEDKLDSAKDTLEKLLVGNPKHYSSRWLLATVYEAKNDFAAAEQTLIDLLREYPEDASLYAKYSLLMLTTMHTAKASQLAASAVALDPENDSALRASVFCKLVTTPGPEATAELHRLIQTYPDALPTAFTMTTVLNDQGRYKEALSIAQEILQQRPDSPEVVDLVVSLKVTSHWSMKPLAPFIRWGWRASIAFWFAAVIGLRLLKDSPFEPYTGPILIILVAYVIYSWFYPPFLRWLIRR
jgi:predicted Zn-dependent protease